jgi:tetratricopeptide (TPR) repeat protein
MGCILYELASGGKKAFALETDLAAYAESQTEHDILLDNLHESWRADLSHIILGMLEIDSTKRPSAHDGQVVFAVNRKISVGDWLQQRKQYDEAIKVYKSAIGYSTKRDAIIWKRLGDVSKAKDDFPEAVQSYHKAVTAGFPRPALLAHDLGTALSDHTDLAVETYKLAIKMDPSNALLWKLAGDAYLSQSQYEGAIKMYRKAIKRGLSEPSVLGNLGRAYFATGDVDRAIKAYNAAMKKSPIPSLALLEARTAAYAAKEKISLTLPKTKKARFRRWFSSGSFSVTGKQIRQVDGENTPRSSIDYDTQFTDTDDELSTGRRSFMSERIFSKGIVDKTAT